MMIIGKPRKWVRDERENNQINKTAAPARPSRLSRSASIAFFFPHTQFLFFSLFKGEKRPRQRETRVQSVKMTSIVLYYPPTHKKLGEKKDDDNAVVASQQSGEIMTYHLLNQIFQVCRLISFLHRLSRDSAEIFLVVFKHFF
jgi:hypothetical protein